MKPVDLLLITWNRLGYLEKTLPALLRDPADFRLYCWDNGSTEGTAELIAETRDPRIAERHLHPTNVGQQPPWMWFLEKSSGDVAGKIDDDILLPTGWIESIAAIIRKDSKFGMLGCWPFMPEEWDEAVAKQNIVEISKERVFRCVRIQGHSFLARKEYLTRYTVNPSADHGLPVDQLSMSRDGLITGYPLPLLCTHNMDDPRSPLNIKTYSGKFGKDSSLTARTLGFETAKNFADWIAHDAHTRQATSFTRQLERALLNKDNSLMGKIKKKLLGVFFGND